MVPLWGMRGKHAHEKWHGRYLRVAATIERPGTSANVGESRNNDRNVLPYCSTLIIESQPGRGRWTHPQSKAGSYIFGVRACASAPVATVRMRVKLASPAGFNSRANCA